MKLEWYTQRSDRGLHFRLDVSYRKPNETSSGTSGCCSCFGKLIERHELPLSTERFWATIDWLRTKAKQDGFRI